MTEHKSTEQSIELAAQAGFTPYNTGGGSMAFYLEHDGTYYLITDEFDGISGNHDDPAWNVGRYTDDTPDDPDSAYRWTYVEETITLEQALIAYKSIQKPELIENRIKSWSDLGVEISALETEGPKLK